MGRQEGEDRERGEEGVCGGRRGGGGMVYLLAAPLSSEEDSEEVDSTSESSEEVDSSSSSSLEPPAAQNLDACMSSRTVMIMMSKENSSPDKTCGRFRRAVKRTLLALKVRLSDSTLQIACLYTKTHIHAAA